MVVVVIILLVLAGLAGFLIGRWSMNSDVIGTIYTNFSDPADPQLYAEFNQPNVFEISKKKYVTFDVKKLEIRTQE